MRMLAMFSIFLWSVFSYCASLSPLQIYDSTTDIVTKNFYDQTFRGLAWPKLVQQYRQNISNTSNPKELQKTINALLDNLHASHTEFVTSDDQEYHGLQCIFSGEISGDEYFQSGGWFQNIDGKYFVRNIYPGTPLEKSGIVTGDEILSADGQPFTEIRSFDKDTPVTIKYRHEAYGPVLTTIILPKKYSVQELQLSATQVSKKIYLLGTKKVGYFHLWSGTNDAFLNALQTAIADFASSTDMIILDFRDGFGGAWIPYIQPFFDHDLNTGAATPQIYSKPVYVLINDGVRSGKEYISLVMKKEKRATLIGTNTAGHVLAGRWYPIVAGESSLFLAVHGDPTGILEGKGVAPDVVVPSSLPYSQGKDAQLGAALDLIQNLSK